MDTTNTSSGTMFLDTDEHGRTCVIHTDDDGRVVTVEQVWPRP